MAPSKKKKTISAKILPPEKRVIAREDPDSIYAEHPNWSFSACDGGGNWSFTKDRLYHRFWDDVLPKLQSFETMTWASILIDGKKQHHSIPISDLNKAARDRLDALQIVPEKLISLRLGSTLRLYGFLSRATFVILWVDDHHGDNETCVCRSYLKHT